ATASCKICRAEPTQNRRVLRTGGFFMADGISAASKVFALTVPIDGWTDERSSTWPLDMHSPMGR
ncbi:MAG: hypothetical protein ACN6PY_13820, partial [Paraburkholderia nemoris]